MKLRIGTRGSRLALTQATWVSEALRRGHEGLGVELVEIRTAGDRIADVPLRAELGASFFTKEIEDALLDGRIDLAVHSCKDLATRLPQGLALAAFPDREDPRDVLVSSSGPLAALPPGARVGTSSMRRKGFVAQVRSDLVLVDLRGNVPTRVAAVEDGEVEAVVLAAAGLARLGMEGVVCEVFDPSVILPAAGQGALALEVRADDAWAHGLAATLDHAPTRGAVEAERACLRRLGAGCHAPVGALGVRSGGTLALDAAVVTPDGVVRVSGSSAPERAEALGVELAEAILGACGLESLEGVGWAGAPPRRASSDR